MSEWESRLYRRIEQLVGSADDESDGGAVVNVTEIERALVETRSDMRTIHAELADVRQALLRLGEASNPEAVQRAVGEARDVLEERLAVLEDGMATLSD